MALHGTYRRLNRVEIVRSDGLNEADAVASPSNSLQFVDRAGAVPLFGDDAGHPRR
jgi:hypothetical protein